MNRKKTLLKKKTIPAQKLIVVGIGASAGGLEPLQQIMSRLPKSLPNIVIIIAQHLSPDYKSMLVELMARRTHIPVKPIQTGLEVTGNTIFITPATSDAVIEKGKFKLLKSSHLGAHPSIDTLFTSIAREYKQNGVGIILSGTGKDGSEGIVAIKKQGGIVIAQDPESARYEGMPQAAVSTGVVDHVFSQDTIGDQFRKLITKENNELVETQVSEVSESEDLVIRYILDLLEKRIGVDFSNYKMSTIKRRLEKRIQEKKLTDPGKYLTYVRSNPEELETLFATMLIGVTAFFRDKGPFRMVADIYKKIIKQKKQGESLRIWIPGCATGEEAYTHAILILEAMEQLQIQLPVQIFATDIDLRAIQIGRTGKYPEKSLQYLSKDLKKKYFHKIDEATYEVDKRIHSIVLFSKHDVTANPPFLRLDLISCRNLLIYFDNQLQKRVLPLLYYSLNKNGYLMLGKSEDIGRFTNLFSTVDSVNRIYKRTESDGTRVKIPTLRPVKPKMLTSYERKLTSGKVSIAGMAKETIYSTFEHPFVVIDNNSEVLEINGDITPFLQLKAGSATLNITKIIHPDLQLELRSLIGKALGTAVKSLYGNIRKLTYNGKDIFVRIGIKPFFFSQSGSPYFLVIFETVPFEKQFYSVGKEVVEKKDSPHVVELERDLSTTKEYLNSLLQELETSNEELQAMNEELQSSNEELQASNEELESANEELQATNEELENAYAQLKESSKEVELQKTKVLESEQNLKAMMNNTHVGFILVDSEYRVVVFNKVAYTLYGGVFKTKLDFGTSLIQILSEDVLTAFIKNFKSAVDGNQVVTEEEMIDRDGKRRYFQISYTPVETLKNSEKTIHVSMSFLDITLRKNAENSLQRAAAIIESSSDAIIGVSLDGTILAWNKGAEELYGYTKEEALGKTTSMLIAPNNSDDFSGMVRKIKNGEKIEHYETQRRTKNNAIVDISLTVSPIVDDDGNLIGLSKIGRDISERKQFIEEIQYQKSLLEAQREVSPEGILVVSPEGKILSYNQRFAKMWKIPKKVISTQADSMALSAAKTMLVDPQGFMEKVAKSYKERKESFDELHFKDGRIFERYGTPVRGKDGKYYGYVWFFNDITQKRKLERQREEFIAMATHELKTPVTSIKGYAQVMQSRFQKGGDMESASFIGKMDKQLNKLSGLISDLLDVTKIDAGKLYFHETEFDIHELIDEVVENMKQVTDKHVFVTKFTGQKNIHGDRERIGQVITNLISNAIKYSPSDEEINITKTSQNGHIEVSVQDNGMGIPKKDIAHIFERFYRINEDGIDTYSGLGLGLYICTEIIKRHGGDIWAESEGRNRGSTFVFTLPK